MEHFKLSKIFRVILSTILFVAAIFSKTLLLRVESGLFVFGRLIFNMESPADLANASEPTQQAVAALIEYASVPLALILVILGLAILAGPPCLSRIIRNRFFTPSDSTSDRPFLIITLAASIIFAITINTVVFQDFKITPDENNYLDMAKIFTQGKLYGKTPPLPEFFEEPYLVHKDGRFFPIFQPGWPLLLAPAVLLGIQRLVPPLIGALSLLIVFLIGKNMAGRGVARGAVLIMLFSPFYIFHTATYFTHLAELMLVSLFALLFIQARGQQSDARYLFAGLCMAAIMLTRYFDLFFAFPFGLLLLWDIYRRKPGAWKNTVLFTMPVFLAGILALGYQWICMGEPFLAPFKLYLAQARYIYLVSEFTDPVRLYGFSVDYPVSAALVKTVKNLFKLNYWVFPFSLFFLLPILIRPGKWETVFLLGFLFLVLAYLPYVATGGWSYGPRYYLPVLGCLSLLLARGIGTCFSSVRQKWGEQRLFHLLAFWLCLCLVMNICVVIIKGAQLKPWVRGYSDLERTLVKHDVQEGIVFIKMHPDFFMPESWDNKFKEQIKNDFPFYLIHNRMDYEQPLLIAHSLGEEADKRLLDHFPDRPFYLFQADPFLAAFGIGSGTLEQLAR